MLPQALFVCAFGLALQSVAQQPNVLLVIADDLGLDPVPGYMVGPEKAAMPNLEALMAQGLTFDNVWADPLCSPTRSTIITGRYGYRTGVLNPGDLSLLPANEITLHQYLTTIGSGYASCIIGKWHLGGLQPVPAYPNTMGVPHFAGLLSGTVNSYNNWPLTVDGITSLSTDYITTALTDRAIDWIDQQTTPWFCWLAYNAPHTPLHRPPLFMHDQGPLPNHPDSIATNPLPYYLAMVESVDHELGRLLSSLTATELANTVVIFIGDNGTDMNVIQAPYVAGHAKGTLFEGGVRVPMVIAGPAVPRSGEREDALVNSTDLFATIVELTGQPLPTYWDSRSLVPLFAQSGLAVRACSYADVSHGAVVGSAIRDEQWKYIELDNGQQFFFDLLNEPWEGTNLMNGGLTVDEQAAFDLLMMDCSLPTDIGSGPRPQGFGLHPNPSTGEVVLRTPSAGPVSVRVLDALGTLVLSAETTSSINVAALVAGLYFVELRQGKESNVLPLVVE